MMGIMFRKDRKQFVDITASELRGVLDDIPEGTRLLLTGHGTLLCFTKPANGNPEKSWYFGYIDLADCTFHPATESIPDRAGIGAAPFVTSAEEAEPEYTLPYTA